MWDNYESTPVINEKNKLEDFTKRVKSLGKEQCIAQTLKKTDSILDVVSNIKKGIKIIVSSGSLK